MDLILGGTGSNMLRPSLHLYPTAQPTSAHYESLKSKALNLLVVCREQANKLLHNPLKYVPLFPTATSK